MNRLALATKSLLHYWQTNLAVIFGVIAGTAVITGAMIVGDSVRASLKQMTLDRLGKVDFALVGPRFFREDLAERLSKVGSSEGILKIDPSSPVAPAIVMQAGLQARSGSTVRRAGKVNVYGFDHRAWSMIKTDEVDPPSELRVVLNSEAAKSIDAKVGDEVTVWIELPTAIPRDTLMGKKDNDSQEITVKISEIVKEPSGLSRFGLQPTQAFAPNVYLDLHVLQDRLGLELIEPSRSDPSGKAARVNALFISGELTAGSKPATVNKALSQLVQESWSLDDLNLRIVDGSQFPGFVVESQQMILEDHLAEAAGKTANELGCATSPVMVYLANKIWNPKIHQSSRDAGYSMYSTVAGLDVLELDESTFGRFEFVSDRPNAWSEDDIILNEFLAEDLRVTIGDEIRFSYHILGSRGELPELERTVTVRGIVKMAGPAIDRSLIPEVKGITDVKSLSDWDQPFPMQLSAVTSRDEEYWGLYRAIPKMYLPLKTAQKLWPSRYGSLTAVRIAPSPNQGITRENKSLDEVKSTYSSRLLKQIQPADVGLMLQPIKWIGLRAASGSTDFSGLFFGFSLFLIIAAMILIGLLFRLGIEQRVRDLGLLGAVGLTSRQVNRQMFLEGTLLGCAGVAAGSVVAIAYAALMIYGLTHWWVDAVGTRYLFMVVNPLTVITGSCFAVFSAIISIAWALRNFQRISIREKLAGVTEREVEFAVQSAKARRSARYAEFCVVIAAVLLVSSAAGAIPATGAFFGGGILLLAGFLLFLSSWLHAETGVAVRGHGAAALGRFGLRNASRQRQRTTMSAGMIAVATFLIVAVAAFRRNPTGDLPDIKSGNGGFTLVAESGSPILYDLNTSEGRSKLQLNVSPNSAAQKALDAMKVVPFRVKPGEDASCLNLYQTQVPTILGVPQSLIDEGRFAFASGSWKSLATDQGKTATRDSTAVSTDEAPVPVLGDMNTLMFSLHKQVGQTIGIPSEDAARHKLIVKGMFQDSIFQGVLVMSEENFLKLFPEQKGFRYFLIEVPPGQSDELSAVLESELSEYGLDVESVATRLARFLSVQNTYLSTFQTLGGLGLLLGTFGLATVMLRNVLERRAEIALLRAVGFRERTVAMLVLCETAFLLCWGLVAGGGAALLATSPNLLSRGADLPWGSLSMLLIGVFASGIFAALFAVRASVRLPIVKTLRGES